MSSFDLECPHFCIQCMQNVCLSVSLSRPLYLWTVCQWHHQSLSCITCNSGLPLIIYLSETTAIPTVTHTHPHTHTHTNTHPHTPTHTHTHTHSLLHCTLCSHMAMC